MTPLTAAWRVLGVAVVAVAVASCEQPPAGGDPEHALLVATAAHDVASVQRLLTSGADPNKMVPFEGLKRSPWEYVLSELRSKHPEDVEIIKAMLKAGADPTAAWAEHQSLGITRLHPNEPLQVVMLHPNAEAVRALLETGRRLPSRESALVNAIETGETEIAHLLVDSGVDVNGYHGAALTPLVAAIEARDAKMVAYLEEHGAREKP